MAVQSSTKLNLGKVEEIRGAGTAGGTSLTTTAAFIQFPPRTNRISITPRNFTTAVVARLLLNPWLTVLKTVDNMAGSPTDYSANAQDNDTATDVDVSSLSTRANGDFLLVGSHVPFRGVYFDVDGTNTTASCTGSVYYWNNAWVDTSATMSGVTTATLFDKDGIVTWTVPTAWKATTLNQIYTNTVFASNAYYSNVSMYWTRWETDTAITDTSVTFNSMSAANRSTTYAELVEGQAISADIPYGFGGTGSIEALTDAGTANLVVNAVTRGIFG